MKKIILTAISFVIFSVLVYSQEVTKSRLSVIGSMREYLYFYSYDFDNNHTNKWQNNYYDTDGYYCHSTFLGYEGFHYGAPYGYGVKDNLTSLENKIYGNGDIDDLSLTETQNITLCPDYWSPDSSDEIIITTTRYLDDDALTLEVNVDDASDLWSLKLYNVGFGYNKDEGEVYKVKNLIWESEQEQGNQILQTGPIVFTGKYKLMMETLSFSFTANITITKPITVPEATYACGSHSKDWKICSEKSFQMPAEWAFGIDCSGFVSWGYGLPIASYGTNWFAQNFYNIDYHEAQYADYLVWSGHHIVMIDNKYADLLIDVYESAGEIEPGPKPDGTILAWNKNIYDDYVAKGYDARSPWNDIGVEDRVIITSGPTVIEQNQLINEYTAVFDEHHEPGEEPDYIIEWNWKLIAEHESGFAVLDSSSDDSNPSNSHFVPWVTDLDSFDVEWLRNENNAVKGKVTVAALDNDGIEHTDEYEVEIIAAPKTPVITSCESKNQGVRLAYSANGADYCKIFYDINSGEPYNGTGSTLGNSPIIVSGSAVDTTIYGLTNGTTYYFAIKAFNDHDSTQLSEEVFSTPLTYSGTFAQDETWPGLGNSDTVKITGDVTVPQVFALTIQAGAIIEFPTNVNLTINGSIQAIGTDGNRIVFTRTGSSGQWDGIFIHDASGAGSDFDYVDVEHSDYGIYLNNTTAGVTIEHANLRDNTIGFTSEYSSPFTIRYSDITDNNYGMWINSRAVSNNINIKNNWIEDNSNHGIYIQSGVNPYFRECYIRQNGGNGLYCYSNVSPYMLGNKGYNHIHDNLLSGVKAAGNSFPKLGTTSQWGYNHIYDNELYDIENYNSSGYITAKKSYWSENGTSCVYLTPDRRYGDVAYCPMLPEGCSDCEDPDIDSYDPIAGEIDYLKNFESSSSDSIYLKAYETELSEQFAAAIDIYKEQIERNPNCTGADFAIRGIVRCLDALERYNDILKILDYYIDTFPNTKTEIAAKDVSLPLLIYQDQFGLAITRVNALLQNSPKNSVSAVFYKLLLADTYEKRSIGKSGQDRSLSAMYFQTVANQSENEELAFWAQLKLQNMSGSGSGAIALREQQNIQQAVPKTYGLQQNYPNPFNPITTIQYQLPEETTVSLIIYNMNGQIIKKLVNHQVQQAGTYQAQWNATDIAGNAVSSGMYFYKLICNDFVDVKKMLLLR